MGCIQFNEKLDTADVVDVKFFTPRKRIDRQTVDESGGRHFQVQCQMFSLPQIQKTVQLSTGKIQLNADLLAEH